MTRHSLAFAVFLLACACADEAAPSQSVCSAPDAEVRIDHVVVAVPDLDASAALLAESGFTIKPGRLHPNGILNAHVKLRSDQSLELISMAGAPTDAISQEYADLISAGGGGAFLALGVSQQRAWSVGRLGSFLPDSSHHPPFRYVTFGHGGLANVFAIQYDRPFSEAEQHISHPNGAFEVHQVWIESGSELEALLHALGAATCGTVVGPAGETGKEIAVRNGSIVIVPAPADRRALVVGVQVLHPDSTDSLLVVESANDFWMSLATGSSSTKSSR